MAKEKVKVGIAGLGRSGWGIHGRLIGPLNDKYQIVAVFDKDPARLKEANEKFGCRTYKTYGALLKDKEVEEIIASAKASGEREKTRLIEESEKLKIKILEQAKNNIDFEVKKAKEVIKAEAVEAAMQLAEEKLKGKLTKQDQDRLMQESIKLLEGKN